MMHDAREIANFFLDYAEKKNRNVTPMALLKLIYFAHGWHLAQFGDPLVKNTFEAWKDGPVVRVVYDAFSKYKHNPISERAYKFDPIRATYHLAKYDALSESQRFLLQQVFEAYGNLGAFQLSDITHENNSPWHKIWKMADHSTTPGMKISDDSIRAHFQIQHCGQLAH